MGKQADSPGGFLLLQALDAGMVFRFVLHIEISSLVLETLGEEVILIRVIKMDESCFSLSFPPSSHVLLIFFSQKETSFLTSL